MKGKKVVITGGTSGIGKETARELLKRGASVTIAVRDKPKAETTMNELKPLGDINFSIVDLSNLEDVSAFARQFKKRHDQIDVLINNAGIVPTTLQLTRQGFEMQFGVNHLAHFLLTQELLPLLRKAKGRVITVASTMHMGGFIDFDNFYGTKWYDSNIAYMQSKLANILFTTELAKREKDIIAYSLHPGLVDTGIFRDQPQAIQNLMKLFTLTPEEGARTSVYLASQPGIESENGKYFVDCKPAFTMFQARDEKNAAKLWEESLKLVNDYRNV